MNEHGQTSRLQCCAIVGAGELMSRILRIDTDACWPEYRYTIELVDAVPGVGSPLFQPADLPSFVNLLRVLTRELIHDGGFEVAEKIWLNQFADAVDDFCDRINSLPRMETSPNVDGMNLDRRASGPQLKG